MTNIKSTAHQFKSSSLENLDQYSEVNPSSFLEEENHKHLVINSFDDPIIVPANLQIDGKPKSIVISDKLLRGIYSLGFEKPTMVQANSIIPLSLGLDCIFQAQSGTGKTGAFVIGALNRVEWTLPFVQVLILAPTMSLVKQTGLVVKEIGKYCPITQDRDKEWHMVCYGGGRTVEQESRIIRSGVTKIVIGTPGRISHLMRDRVFGNDLKILIFDEADSLLEERFLKEIQDIISRIPRTIQVSFFSATMSEDSKNMARRLVRQTPAPMELFLKDEDVTLDGISQFKVELNCESSEIDQVKLDTLTDIYRQLSVSKCIIFTNTRKRAELVGQHLKGSNHTVSILHGDLAKEERMFVENQFRKGETRILVSSDLLSRGFDVQDLSLVINFDMPSGNMALETYIHRIGRTGRYGRKGMAISFIREKFISENLLIETINNTYGGNILHLPRNVDDVYKQSLGII